jgi:NAD(P)-dependent dehydrogenase (short-subunit alcohol dehydrogenase family)
MQYARGEYAGTRHRQWTDSLTSPSFIDTPLVTPPIRQLLQPQIDKTPMGRMANPQEVADAAVYLASDRASYITGTVLSVST